MYLMHFDMVPAATKVVIMLLLHLCKCLSHAIRLLILLCPVASPKHGFLLILFDFAHFGIMNME